MSGPALFVYNTHETNPYKNIATEAHLLTRVGPGECILYLWQNRHTVVIGRNQNAFKECLVDALESDGGFLARRLSGGGAVYHDMGNLNFTFIAHKDTYSLDKQHEVILQALADFGLKAERSGRNDLCLDGRKFSGNAFYKTGDALYHHGTLLIDVDMANLSTYLNVPKDKLQAKGVSSVRSRVVNLSACCERITTESMRPALEKAFGRVYGAVPRTLTEDDLDGQDIRQRYATFSSPAWRYGQRMQADRVLSARFPWGGVDICLHLTGNQIDDCKVYTDAMDDRLAGPLAAGLVGCAFAKKAMTEAINSLALDETVRQDIVALIEAEAF